MYCVKKMTEDLYWVGGNDRRLALFENVYPIPRGVSYNAYVVLDEKTVLLDTVDNYVSPIFFENLAHVLNGRKLDYLIVNHMEPDHAATIEAVVLRYPEVTLVCNKKTAQMMKNFFSFDVDSRVHLVAEMDTLCTGKHTFAFVMAPMVHWPEVMVTYDATTKTLFAADAFGTFGALGGNLYADEVNFQTEWLDDARRYYTNIVGKYGAQVQALLKKAAAVEIRTICPLHGPVLDGGLSDCLELYRKWSAYTPEEPGVCIAFTSVYGNTRRAAELLAERLRADGTTVALHDLTVQDKSFAIADAFRYDRLVLATTTYNGDVFPAMRAFLSGLTERSFRARRVGLIENGTWAPVAAKVMRGMLEPCRDLSFADTAVRIRSALNEESRAPREARPPKCGKAPKTHRRKYQTGKSFRPPSPKGGRKLLLPFPVLLASQTAIAAVTVRAVTALPVRQRTQRNQKQEDRVQHGCSGQNEPRLGTAVPVEPQHRSTERIGQQIQKEQSEKQSPQSCKQDNGGNDRTDGQKDGQNLRHGSLR